MRKYTFSMFVLALVLFGVTVAADLIGDYWTRMHSAPEEATKEYIAPAPQPKRLAYPARRFSEKDVRCLALNIYHEARGEPPRGRIAVAHVVLNRVQSSRFPATVCAVIKQGGVRRHRCQFSWYCDGESDRPNLRNPVERHAWHEALRLASTVTKHNDPTRGALWYHADSVWPYWAEFLKRQGKIGKHIFYEPPSRSLKIAKN